MSFFTLRNMMVLALLQTGVLLAAVLLASVGYKWDAALRFHPPRSAVYNALAGYGWIGLLLPAAWFAVVIHVLRYEWASARLELGIVLTGFLILAVFLVIGWFGAAVPFFSATRL